MYTHSFTRIKAGWTTDALENPSKSHSVSICALTIDTHDLRCHYDAYF